MLECERECVVQRQKGKDCVRVCLFEGEREEEKEKEVGQKKAWMNQKRIF